VPPRTAGFGNRDRFELNGKIGLHRAVGLIVLREYRQWQQNVALSGSIPLQPAPFFGKFNLLRIVVAENPVFQALPDWPVSMGSSEIWESISRNSERPSVVSILSGRSNVIQTSIRPEWSREVSKTSHRTMPACGYCELRSRSLPVNIAALSMIV